mgnify:FL=1
MSCDQKAASAKVTRKSGRAKDLVAEGVEVLDRVRLDDGVDGSSWSLKVREDVVREELDDVDERVRGRDSVLQTVHGQLPLPVARK